jgi:DNA recombination protein RmuC
MNVLFILLGIIIGAISAWLIAKFKFQTERGIPKEELEKTYVLRELYNRVEVDLNNLREEIKEKDDKILNLNKDLSAKEQSFIDLDEKLENNKKEVESLQEKFKEAFENIANRLLEDKSKKFLQLNKESIDGILNPLKEKIDEFRKKVEDTYTEEVKDMSSLKTEITHLSDLNKQVSDDANKLANALKGETKVMGNWGEMQLEIILEKSGLQKNIHYRKQEVFSETEDKKQPDYIINLPEEKHLIIDSKVSVVAYEKYFNAEKEEERQRYLSEHLDSVKNHIKNLSSKNYQNIYQINQPDYVLMFVPREPAYILIMKEDSLIFDFALNKNIVLVTGSTLMATLRTVSYIWRQENQKKNVLEIARQSGALYDKFVDFVNDLLDVGKKLESAKDSYNDAMNKLRDSKKKGDTLLGRAEKIKELGARTTKALPQELINGGEDGGK